MIIGHGIDLVEIDRVNNIYAKYKKISYPNTF